MSRFRSTSVTIDDEGPQRWDREKFEQFRTRRPYEREDFRYDERDRAGPRGSVRDVAVDDRIERRGPRGGRYDEDVRYFEEDRFTPGRRRMDFMDDPLPAEVARQALAPYRRREIAEAPARRPVRPQYIRRQSSLDIFDRKPMPRYGDEYRIPADVPIPLPIRRPRSPPRARYREETFEEVGYRDLPARDFDEYRDIRVRRERHGRARSQSRAAMSTRSSSSSSSSFEEVNVPEPQKLGKRGKTRMPKRLVHKKAIVDMGLPFEEEDDFIIVQRALTKVHIDEIIEKSKGFRDDKTVFKYTADAETETTKEEVKEEFREEKREEYNEGDTIIKKTTIIEGLPPPPGSVRAPSPARTEKSHRTAKSHRSHHHGGERETFEEEIVEKSNAIGGPLTVISPDQRHQSEDDIRHEIRELELERRALRSERGGELVRQRGSIDDYEVVERVDRWDGPARNRARSKSVVRIEKDRKGRLALVRSTH